MWWRKFWFSRLFTLLASLHSLFSHATKARYCSSNHRPSETFHLNVSLDLSFDEQWGLANVICDRGSCIFWVGRSLLVFPRVDSEHLIRLTNNRFAIVGGYNSGPPSRRRTPLLHSIPGYQRRVGMHAYGRSDQTLMQKFR